MRAWARLQFALASRESTRKMATATIKSGFGRAKLRGSARSRVCSPGKNQAQGHGFRIAGVQMASGPNVAGQSERGRSGLIEMAAAQGAKLVALPEYFAIMGMRATDKVKVREKDGDGPIQQFLAETARQPQDLAGGLLGAAGGARRGQGLQFLPGLRRHRENGGALRQDPPVRPRPGQGEVFGAAHASSRASSVKVVDSPFGRIGLSVCYDLRFPGAVSRDEGRGHHRRALGVHRDHRHARTGKR